MECFDLKNIRKFSFLSIPSKKLVNHAAEKYWNKLFFDSQKVEKYVKPIPENNQTENFKDYGKVLKLKHYHESEWLLFN